MKEYAVIDIKKAAKYLYGMIDGDCDICPCTSIRFDGEFCCEAEIGGECDEVILNDFMEKCVPEK